MKTGKVPENILKRSVLKQLKTRRKEVLSGTGIGEDCAIFALLEKELLASCMQEAAVAVKADMDCAEADRMTIAHLIQKIANNLAVKGAEPIAAMVTFLLPETCEESLLKKLTAEAEEACRMLSMQIVGGQTRVSTAVKVPFAIITGYGKIPEMLYLEQIEDSGEKKVLYSGNKRVLEMAKAVKPGQDIVLSKWIGLEGTAILARRCREKLLLRYPAYLVEEAAEFEQFYSILPEAKVAIQSGVCAMHDASEGGIFAALWELCESAGVGLTIDLKKIPLRQETVEVCECCGINPYELLSGGCLVMTTEDGPALAAALKKERIPVAIIGKITDSNDRIICNEEEVRYMDRPKTDEIYKIEMEKKE